MKVNAGTKLGLPFELVKTSNKKLRVWDNLLIKG
jgi:hypothetical protein